MPVARKLRQLMRGNAGGLRAPLDHDVDVALGERRPAGESAMR